MAEQGNGTMPATDKPDPRMSRMHVGSRKDLEHFQTNARTMDGRQPGWRDTAHPAIQAAAARIRDTYGNASQAAKPTPPAAA